MEVTDAARGSGDAQVLTGIPVVGANDPVKDPMQLEIKEQVRRPLGWRGGGGGRGCAAARSSLDSRHFSPAR